jgi:hypothetical protein
MFLKKSSVKPSTEGKGKLFPSSRARQARRPRKEPSKQGWVDPLSLKMGDLDGVYEAGTHDIIGTIVASDMTVTFQDGYTVNYKLSLERVNGNLCIQATQNGYSHYILEGVKPVKNGHMLFLRDNRKNAKKRSTRRLYTWKPIRKIALSTPAAAAGDQASAPASPARFERPGQDDSSPGMSSDSSSAPSCLRTRSIGKLLDELDLSDCIPKDLFEGTLHSELIGSFGTAAPKPAKKKVSDELRQKMEEMVGTVVSGPAFVTPKGHVWVDQPDDIPNVRVAKRFVPEGVAHGQTVKVHVAGVYYGFQSSNPYGKILA